MTTPIIGILLAGGQSRRMGSDKAELNINGQSQLERTQKLLEQAGCKQVFISRNSSEGIADIYFNQGPLAGVHAVLSQPQLPQNCLALVVPVDMPLLTTKVLTELINQAKASNLNSYFEYCFLPCALHIDSNSKADIEQRLLNQQRSVKGYLMHSGAAVFASHSTRPLINTNTPSEWQQACHELQNNPIQQQA